MHVLDYIVDRLSRLFRFNNYPLIEKAYAGLSLRDLSDMASRESVRRWFHRFSRIFSVGKKFVNTIALDEAMVKLHGIRAYVWSAVDIDSRLLRQTGDRSYLCSPTNLLDILLNGLIK